MKLQKLSSIVKRRWVFMASVLILALVPTVILFAHLGGAQWLTFSLPEDPGISYMLVIESPHYRIIRDYAEPGATRRMHNHPDATSHALTVVTGSLVLTVEGEPPVKVSSGQTLTLKGGVNHTFTNEGPVTATIVEIFSKANQ